MGPERSEELFLPFDHPFRIEGENRAVETIRQLGVKERPTRLAERFFAEVPGGGYRLVTDSINADLRARRSLLVG